MKEETREYLKRNGGIFFFAIIIIGTILFSELMKFPLERFKLLIMLMALFIIWQALSQALRHESKELQKKVMMVITIMIVILYILGLTVFSF